MVELGKNVCQPGHEREYAACMGLVLANIASGRDRSTDLEDILDSQYDAIRALPEELRKMIDASIESLLSQD